MSVVVRWTTDGDDHVVACDTYLEKVSNGDESNYETPAELLEPVVWFCMTPDVLEPNLAAIDVHVDNFPYPYIMDQEPTIG